MKTLMLLTLFLFGGAISAQTSQPDGRVAARQSGKRERMLRKTGGFILRLPENAGCFKVINAQKAVPTAEFAPFVKDMGRFTSTIVLLEDTDLRVALSNATDVVRRSGAGGCVFLVDEPGLPISLVAQEARWGIVNVAALKDGAPPERLLALRAAREAWRVFALVTGAGDTSMGHCLLKPVFAAEDIDRLNTNSISPEPLMAMRDHMKAMGIKQVSRCTYLEACREGWAPAPTNEYQKAIWEQVKADKERGPTNPITIQPPKK